MTKFPQTFYSHDSNKGQPRYLSNKGQPRYLKVKGNGENTLSYPKFDISKIWRHPNMMYMCSKTVPTENQIEMKAF